MTQPGGTRSIRSFTPRYRLSALTRDRLERLLPAYEVGSSEPELAVVTRGRGPVVLEIGAGHGAAAIGYAQAFPSATVLVAEIHLPGVARMLASAEEAGVTNLRVFVGDALDLLEGALPAASVDSVHLLFPDPWPKRRHEKRRLVQPHTLDFVARVLRPGGALLLATDHPTYAAHARAAFARHGGFVVMAGERPSWKPLDGFEAKARDAGRPAIYLTAVTKAS